MADVMGYVTIMLDADDEKFVWERISLGGNSTEAYLSLHPELVKQYPDEKKRRKIAADRAARIAVKRGVEERHAQVQEIIGREWLMKIKNYHGRSIDYDPLLFFKPCGSELVARSVQEIPEEIRRLCSVDTRVVGGRLVTVLVPPDKTIDFGGAREIFSSPVQARPGWRRIGLDTELKTAAGLIALVEGQGAIFERAYDREEGAERGRWRCPLYHQ